MFSRTESRTFRFTLKYVESEKELARSVEGKPFKVRNRGLAGSDIQLDPAAYIGGGVTYGFGGYTDGMDNMGVWSFGLGGGIGTGQSEGGQITGSPNDLGGSKGLGRLGVGWGINVGFDFCYSKITCDEGC